MRGWECQNMSANWIILTVKLPTRPSPPKLSIFYAAPWPMEGDLLRQQKADYNAKHEFDIPQAPPYEQADSRLLDRCGFGFEANLSQTLKIRYKGEDIRVFRHECNDLTDDRLEDYLSDSHVRVPQHATAQVIHEMLNDPQSELRLIFDAARLDGATLAQALFTALRADPDNAASRIGESFWWRCRHEYASYWCTSDEMEE